MSDDIISIQKIDNIKDEQRDIQLNCYKEIFKPIKSKINIESENDNQQFKKNFLINANNNINKENITLKKESSSSLPNDSNQNKHTDYSHESKLGNNLNFINNNINNQNIVNINTINYTFNINSNLINDSQQNYDITLKNHKQEVLLPKNEQMSYQEISLNDFIENSSNTITSFEIKDNEVLDIQLFQNIDIQSNNQNHSNINNLNEHTNYDINKYFEESFKDKDILLSSQDKNIDANKNSLLGKKKIFINYKTKKPKKIKYTNIPKELLERNIYKKKNNTRKKIIKAKNIFYCIHPHCNTSYSSKKLQIAHHNKMNKECVIDEIELLNLISKVKKIILNKNLRNVNINLYNDIKYKYEKVIQNISLYDYAQAILGFEFEIIPSNIN